MGGKYVYGYNWALKRDEVAPWDKGGWWRLTFYTPDRSIVFTNAAIPTTPPPVVPSTPLIFTILAGDTGPLYAPVIDVANNLTYIDICVSDTAGGGKGGGRT